MLSLAGPQPAGRGCADVFGAGGSVTNLLGAAEPGSSPCQNQESLGWGNKAHPASRLGAASSLLPLLPLAGCCAWKGSHKYQNLRLQVPWMPSPSSFLHPPATHPSDFTFFPSTSLVSTNPEVQLLHFPLSLQYFRPKIAVGLEKGRARPEPQETGTAAAPGEQPAVGTAGWAPTATLSIILPSQPRAGGVKVTLGSKAPSAGSRI